MYLPLYHLELKRKPVDVGRYPETRHGIVLAVDYVEKKYGVNIGMALWQAKLGSDYKKSDAITTMFVRIFRMG
jgi:nucleotidyltransferase/DNA polymerase involved in DNA repair